MMNYLWGGMITLGIIYAAFAGRMEAVTQAAIQSAQDAITLCITMAGVMALWVGIMKIAEHGGIVDKMNKLLAPALKFLFPNIPAQHPAMAHIGMNVIANILGLGWAATPAGLKAMEELENLRKEQGYKEGIATNEMCNFLILNISSLQLIPVNLIAYRSQYGSAQPAAIIVPAIIATSLSTFAGIVYIKIADQKRKKEG